MMGAIAFVAVGVVVALVLSTFWSVGKQEEEAKNDDPWY